VRHRGRGGDDPQVLRGKSPMIAAIKAWWERRKQRCKGRKDRVKREYEALKSFWGEI